MNLRYNFNLKAIKLTGIMKNPAEAGVFKNLNMPVPQKVNTPLLFI